jgi:hypothetical protein
VRESRIHILVVGGSSVDPLLTDEAYESIGADMSDHDRRRSRAHLLPHISMNTSRRAHGVRG